MEVGKVKRQEKKRILLLISSWIFSLTRWCLMVDLDHSSTPSGLAALHQKISKIMQIGIEYQVTRLLNNFRLDTYLGPSPSRILSA